MAKIFVSNITSNTELTYGLRKLVCDLHDGDSDRVQAVKVLSREEYESVETKGYFVID